MSKVKTKVYIDYAPTPLFKKVASPAVVAAHADNFGRETDLRHLSKVVMPAEDDEEVLDLGEDEEEDMKVHIKQCEKDRTIEECVEDVQNMLLDSEERALLKANEMNQQL